MIYKIDVTQDDWDIASCTSDFLTRACDTRQCLVATAVTRCYPELKGRVLVDCKRITIDNAVAVLPEIVQEEIDNWMRYMLDLYSVSKYKHHRELRALTFFIDKEVRKAWCEARPQATETVGGLASHEQ